MMEAIRELQSEGYRFTLEGDQIHYMINEGQTPDKDKVVRLFAELKKHKTEAVAFLKASTPSKGQRKIIDPGRHLMTVTVYSVVLGREVFVQWQGDNPESVMFDGIAYTLAEIAKLKEMPLTVDDLRAIHDAKFVFAGELE